jgi:hypothetical protein
VFLRGRQGCLDPSAAAPLAALAAWLHLALSDPAAAIMVLLAALPALAPALPLAAGMAADRRELRMERNFARDARVFRSISKADKNSGKLQTERIPVAQNHRHERMEKVAQWRWQGDNRVFFLPLKLAKHLKEMHFVRDVLAAVTTLYLLRPNGQKVVTTFRELCRVMGAGFNHKMRQRVMDALSVLRMYTIQDQNVPVGFTKKGEVEWGAKVFGFIDAAIAVTHSGDSGGPRKPLPPRKQRLEIQLSAAYTDILSLGYKDKTFLCSVPVDALEAARKLPRRQVPHAKNIVYYIAGRGGWARMKLDTLADAMGLHARWDKEATKLVENILNRLAERTVLTWRKDARGTYWLRLGTHANAADAGTAGAGGAKKKDKETANAANSDSETKPNNRSED